MPELNITSSQKVSNAAIDANDKSKIIFINDKISWQAKLLNSVLLKRILKPLISKVTKEELDVKASRSGVKYFDKLAAKHKSTKAKNSDSQTLNQQNPEQFSTRNLANVPCSYLETTSTNERILLYFHGGGFCIHLPKTYEHFVGKLAQDLNANAFMPNYRLAPEHPFPAGIDDCLNVYKQLLKIGYQAKNIIISGDSAGGNLTLTTLIQIRDQNLPAPAAAILISPATDVSTSGFELMAENSGKDSVFTIDALKTLTLNYTTAAIGGDNKLVSPLLNDLHGLPAMQFHVGSTELLLNNSVRANDKANKAGTDSQLVIWNNMPHVHPLFTWLPESKRALNMMVNFADKHLN